MKKNGKKQFLKAHFVSWISVYGRPQIVNRVYAPDED